jgi:hypothetical protein
MRTHPIDISQRRLALLQIGLLELRKRQLETAIEALRQNAQPHRLFLVPRQQAA